MVATSSNRLELVAGGDSVGLPGGAEALATAAGHPWQQLWASVKMSPTPERRSLVVVVGGGVAVLRVGHPSVGEGGCDERPGVVLVVDGGGVCNLC